MTMKMDNDIGCFYGNVITGGKWHTMIMVMMILSLPEVKETAYNSL